MNDILNKIGVTSFLFSLPYNLSFAEIFKNSSVYDSLYNNLLWLIISKLTALLTLLWLTIKIYNEISNLIKRYNNDREDNTGNV